MDITCVLCYRDVYLCSVGQCEHSVCFECSARMRVLLDQKECPICRKDLDHVIFSKGRRAYKDLEVYLRRYTYLPRYGIYLEDDDIRDSFDALLEARCHFCPKPKIFKDFPALRQHIQREHEMYPCDLCIDHIKLFPVERRFYIRADLAYHKRKGDKNDTSHRGHPNCKFCDQRYFDEDELYKHLRKDHYFCHFCDADGFNHYYNAYEDLRVHFRCEHFLCEEENCKDEKFTSVFRSEIDLKAHLASAHSRLLGKHGLKQVRNLDLEFNLAPRPEDGKSRRHYRGGNRERERDRTDEVTTSDNYTENSHSQQTRGEIVQVPSIPKPELNLESSKDFPTLGDHGQSSTNGTSSAAQPQAASRDTTSSLATNNVAVNRGGGQQQHQLSQRLALSNGMNVSSSKAMAKEGGSHSNPKPNWNVKVTGSNKMDEEFPALRSTAPAASSSSGFTGSRNQPGPKSFINVTKIAAKPPSISAPSTSMKAMQKVPGSEEFPALGNSSAGGSKGSAWSGSGVKMKGGRGEYQGKKVAPAPLLPTGRPQSGEESSSNGFLLNRDEDFKYVPLSVGINRNKLKANNFGDYQPKRK